MSKQDAARHSQFPHVPAKAFTRPDPFCGGCSKAGAAGHETCAEFGPDQAAIEAELFEAQEAEKLQWMNQRRQIDSDGVPGSYNEAVIDSWKPYNAKDSFNYADSASFEVTGTSGKQLTLKTLDGSDASEIVLYTYRLRDTQVGLKWVNGFVKTGSVKPGYIIQFSGNSKISLTCWPVIVKIISCVGDTLVVETDKAAPGALSHMKFLDPGTGEYVEDTNPITCKVWHHEGNPPGHRNVIKPDYFPGKQRIRLFSPADIPASGVVRLADVPVMHPGGFFPGLHPTWTFEGLRFDNGQWETVPQQDDRLFTLPDGAYVAFKDLKPAEGRADLTLSDDLTETYTQWRLTYWEKTDSSDSGCAIVGYGRCIHSVPDPTASVENYGGPGSSAGGRHYQCLKKVYDHHDIEDNFPEGAPDGIDDTAVHSKKAASGLARYPDSGLCLQWNCCDQMTAAEQGGPTAPFVLWRDGGLVYLEIWGSCRQRLVRLIPRVPSFSAWQAQSLGPPSLCWHAGYVGLQTPTTIDEQDAVFRGHGLWGEPYVWTDAEGNQTIGVIQGGFDGWFPEDPDADGAGQFPAKVAGFTNSRDPLDPAGTVVGREMERVAPLVEKTTGELQGHRGIAHSSMAVPAQDLIIPNVDLEDDTRVQTRANGTFERKTDGSKSIIKITHLRQETKAAVSLGQRQVHSVTDLGDGRVSIEWENGEHVWSFIDDGPEIGDSYDAKVTFIGGGIWPIVPKPYQQIQSAYEPNKYAGARNAGAWRGDALGHGDRRFLIDSVEPHGGSEAPNWGGSYYRKYGYVNDGIWRASEVNTLLPDTDPEEHGNITITEVLDTGDSSVLALVDSAERPAAMVAETYWTEANAAYFAPDDAGKVLKISYIVAGKAGTFEEFYTVPANWELSTVVPVADWTGSDAQTVTANGVALSLVAGPAVAGGEYYVDTSGTYVKFYGSILQGGMAVEISLRFDTEAPAPLDHYSLGGNYPAIGKKRDKTVGWDDADGYLLSLTPGTWVDFYHGDIVMMPGATLEFTDYATNIWTAVPAEVRHGTGELLVDNSWFDGRTGNVCWKAKNVRWMDHRGIMSAAVINKTREAERSLEWVTTGMGGGRGMFYFGWTASQDWAFSQDPVTCEWDPPTPQAVLVQSDPDSTFENIVNVSRDDFGIDEVNVAISSTGYGMPLPLAFFPDDTTFPESNAEVYAEGLTRWRYQGSTTFSCDNPPVTDEPFGPFPGSATPPESIDYAFIGFTGPGEFEHIGSIGAGAPGKRDVVPVTDIIQTMFDDRGVGKYAYGYGVLAVPANIGFSGSNVEGLLPTEPPPTQTYGPCSEGACPSKVFTDFDITTLEWTNISIGRVAINAVYSEAERERRMPWYPWPSQKAIA